MRGRKESLAGAFAPLSILLAVTVTMRGGEPEPGSGARADRFDIDHLTTPTDPILSDGPGKDSIPAITDPDIVPVDDSDFLEPEDRVIGVTVDGQSRAYPLRMLNWHEVINDRFGDTPFAVIYCPLCDSASVIDRRIDGEALEFGVSGLLFNSNVLLYDHTDDALWSRIQFEAVSGPYAGEVLPHPPFEITSFQSWRQQHSDVATFDTDHDRPYDENPYEQYFDDDGLACPLKDAGEDDRLPLKEPVLGIAYGDTARAYAVADIAADEGRVEDRLDDRPTLFEPISEQGQDG